MTEQTEKKRRSGSVLVNGELLDHYREQKGWNDLKLAMKAGVATKTIERARQGKPIRIDSLSRIAEAFGVLPVKLMTEVDKLIRPGPASARKPRMLVFVVVDDDTELSQFLAKGSVQELALTLKYAGYLKDGILKEQVFDGSKILVMGISNDDYERLLSAYQVNNLLWYNIVYVGAVSGDRPLEEQLAEVRQESAHRIDELRETRARLAKESIKNPSG